MSEFYRSGRIPFERIDIEYDRCRHDYGTSPCAAVLGTTGERKCFNTKKTCQSPDNFSLTDDTFYVSFSSNQVSSIIGEYVIPSLVNVSISPAKLNPAGGGSLSALGSRSTVSVTLQDHNHTDRVVDPYVDERKTGAAQSDGVGYDPYSIGTFWGKFRARNEYLINREIRYTSGYIVDGVMQDTEVQTFYSTGFGGPDANGKVIISGIDPLGLIRNDKAQAPARSTGSLFATINAGAGSLALTPTGVGSTYPASGLVRIDDEVIAFTRSGDTMTLTRAQNYTTAAEHEAGALVQLCLEYSSELASDILYDLLTTYGGIPASLINLSAWDAEVTEHAARLYSTVIAEPTGVASLVAELTEQAGVYVWYDGRDNQIRLRAVRPADTDTIYEFDDERHIIEDSFTPKDDYGHLVTQVWVSFAQRDPTKPLDEASNYAAAEVAVDLEAEGAAAVKGSSIRRIYSRWIPAAGGAAALEIAEAILRRYKQPVRIVTFSIDAKDRDVDLADFIELSHRQIQDEIGRKASLTYQVIERAEAVTGTTLRITAQEAPVAALQQADEVVIIIAADLVNVNLREVYDSQVGGTPVSGDKIRFIVRPNVFIGGYACGVYPTGVEDVSDMVGRFERRGLYKGDISLVCVQKSSNTAPMALTLYGAFISSVVKKYMPVLQRRGIGAGAFYNIGDSYQMGAGSADLLCDLRVVPTVASLRVGNWPSGVEVTLEIQPGAEISGEGGAASMQYGEPDALFAPNFNSGGWAGLGWAGVGVGVLNNLVRAWRTRGVRGGDGGDAIDATAHPLTIINNGRIRAGAGGGSAALAFRDWTPEPTGGLLISRPLDGWFYCGGGARGFYGGESVADGVESPKDRNTLGRRGSMTSRGVPQRGKITLGSGGVPRLAYVRGGRGGAGTDDGDAGSIVWADNGNDVWPGFETPGGNAGRAVVGSSNVTWLTRGVVTGREV